MKKTLFLFLLGTTLLFAKSERELELENENMKLRLLMKKMEKEQQSDTSVDKAVKQEKWYYGAGIVYGTTSYGYPHQRVDLYFLNTSTPKITYKLGYAQEELGPNESENTATSKDLYLGIGYNLYVNEGYFIDAGLFYLYVLEVEDMEGKVNIYSDNGGTRKFTKLTHPSSPGVEIGFGYSFGNFSVRADIVAVLGESEFEDIYVDSNGNEAPNTIETDPYNRTFAGIGLVYWF